MHNPFIIFSAETLINQNFLYIKQKNAGNTPFPCFGFYYYSSERYITPVNGGRCTVIRE